MLRFTEASPSNARTMITVPRPMPQLHFRTPSALSLPSPHPVVRSNRNSWERPAHRTHRSASETPMPSRCPGKMLARRAQCPASETRCCQLPPVSRYAGRMPAHHTKHQARSGEPCSWLFVPLLHAAAGADTGATCLAMPPAHRCTSCPLPSRRACVHRPRPGAAAADVAPAEALTALPAGCALTPVGRNRFCMDVQGYVPAAVQVTLLVAGTTLGHEWPAAPLPGPALHWTVCVRQRRAQPLASAALGTEWSAGAVVRPT